MNENRKVIIDAGHGGPEPGAVYNGRKEKNDTLRLAFDLGSALERRGIQVSYTRVEDAYDTPYEKAAMGNQSGADFFVSIHRNAMPVPGTGSGIENLVFSASGTAGLLGKNIGRQLAAVGWTDLGVKERPGLVVLRRTKMPDFLTMKRTTPFLMPIWRPQPTPSPTASLRPLRSWRPGRTRRPAGRSLDFIWRRPGCSGCAPMPRPSFRS